MSYFPPLSPQDIPPTEEELRKYSHPKSRGLYYVMPSQIMDCKELKPLEKLLYILLSGLAHNDGTCFPSDAYLSERLDVNASYVGRMIKRLHEIGLIDKVAVPHPKYKFRKSRKITVYQTFKKCLRTTPQCDSETTPQCGVVSEVNSNKESSLKGAKESAAASKPSARIARAAHVFSSFEEHEKLVKDFGEEMVQRAYQKLSEWKSDTPKSKWKKNDHLAIRRWVIESLREQDIKAEKASKTPENRLKEVHQYIVNHPKKEALKQAINSLKIEYNEKSMQIIGVREGGYIDFTKPCAKELIDQWIRKMNL